MLRLMQTSDLHLGARDIDLGEAAATLRDRRLAAFERSLALALSESVNVVLIVGDLFDSNAVTRGLVNRVGSGLASLAAAGIRTVILPGEHDRLDAVVGLSRLRLSGAGRCARRAGGPGRRSGPGR
jgi:exonuclease SbcD